MIQIIYNKLKFDRKNLPSSSSSPKEPLPIRTFIIQFFDFLKTFGIIGLAIAFVIGQAASILVTALVGDIINPLVGLFLPSGSLEQLSAKITSVSGAISEFKYGDFIANIIDFLIIALVVFVAYKALSKYKIVEDKTKTEQSK
ncbi:MAG TPA: MscL family protein [Nitrososphaeraceae archaeon]|nr:MscL family protein [Nitrososphaeraceae archaeon]